MTATTSDVPPLDEKAKRTRELLASFYAPDPAAAASTTTSPRKVASQDFINSADFDSEKYMNHLIHTSSLEGLVQKHIQVATEIKNLDTDLQMLVYENYNKFISATDTIKRMKNNIFGMEANMGELRKKISSVQTKSDTVNTSLFEKREHVEKLHRKRNLLRKVQFIYDLPSRLGKCIKSEAYADAVRFFIGAKPIFEAYGGSSFHDCKKASEEAIKIVTENLQAKLYLDSEPIESRAEAVVLLKQLNFPVDNLKIELLDRLEALLSDLDFETRSKSATAIDFEDHSKEEKLTTIYEFSQMVRAYRIIFPESEGRLVDLTQNLFIRHFQTIEFNEKKRIVSADLLLMLRIIWADVSVMDEVLPQASLPIFCFEATRGVINQYIASMLACLLNEVSGTLTGCQLKDKEISDDNMLHTVMESSKKAVIQGTMELLLDFRQLLDDNLEVLVKLRDLIIDWVQEGFHKFFYTLKNHFFLLCEKGYTSNHDAAVQDRVQTGIVLVLAQLSLFIEQRAIPRITEEIASSFSGGSVRGYEYGPAFVPGEICRIFHSAGEKLLNSYICLKMQKISVLLKKRFMTPNWIKHKEPREVHMFVDLLLQQLEEVGEELRQILPRSLIERHHRTESVGSGNSSRGNPMREDKNNRSNSQRARSQFLESHLAKLFEQKMEIFTKVEFTQESVISTIVKLCLKSLQEFIRLQTFNRSGYQQIQLDIEYLKNPLKDIAEHEAAIDLLIQEINNAAHERCLDPITLEPAIMDRLIQAKLTKSTDQSAILKPN